MVEGSCTFCIGTEKEITKFKWYGNPEGTFEMDDQKITLYKKSKVVRQAFGLIGSAMSGKGKYEAEITKEQIVGYKHDKKGSFWIDLSDSNKFYFCITGLGKKDKYDLVEKFLSDAVKTSGIPAANTENEIPVNNAPVNTGFKAAPSPQPAYTNPSPAPNPAYANPTMQPNAAYTNPVPASKPTYANPAPAQQPVYTNPTMQSKPTYTNPSPSPQPVYVNPAVSQPAYPNASAPQPQPNQASPKLKFSASYRTITPHTENNSGNVMLNQSSGATSQSVENIAQQLKMYKELLDSGLITQEDFNAKKKQLLNL